MDSFNNYNDNFTYGTEDAPDMSGNVNEFRRETSVPRERNVKPAKKGGFVSCMRYVFAAAIVAYVCLLMVYTSGSNKPFGEVEAAVEKTLDQGNLTEQTTQMLKRNFGLNSADYEGVMYYSSEFSISAEEVLVIKVKDESQVRAVTDAVKKRIESRINDFEGYAPEEVKMLQDAKQSVRGKYIFFAAAPKAEKYLEAFSGSL